MTKKSIRTNLLPALTLTFFVVALTGIMMMFHLGIGGIKPLHEWMSVVFLILCAIHLVINWKIFVVHLKKGPAIVSIILICVLSLILLTSGGGNGKDGRHGHYGTGRGIYSNYNR
nr:DUF4405 domain-containing protein [uncultured Desulfobacter sp.]